MYKHTPEIRKEFMKLNNKHIENLQEFIRKNELDDQTVGELTTAGIVAEVWILYGEDAPKIFDILHKIAKESEEEMQNTETQTNKKLNKNMKKIIKTMKKNG